MRFKEDPPNNMRSMLSLRKATVKKHAAALGAFEERVEVPNEKFTIVTVAQTKQSRAERQAAAVQILKADADVAKVNPVY